MKYSAMVDGDDTYVGVSVYNQEKFLGWIERIGIESFETEKDLKKQYKLFAALAAKVQEYFEQHDNVVLLFDKPYVKILGRGGKEVSFNNTFNNKQETVKMANNNMKTVSNMKKVSPVNGKFNLLVSGHTKDINLLARLGKLVFDAGMKYKGIEVICPREVSHYVYQIVKPNVKNGFHFTIGNHLATMTGISAVVVLADNELSDTQAALVGYLDKMEKAPAYRIISNKKKEEKKEEKVAVK